jgi:hypothetical protein
VEQPIAARGAVEFQQPAYDLPPQSDTPVKDALDGVVPQYEWPVVPDQPTAKNGRELGHFLVGYVRAHLAQSPDDEGLVAHVPDAFQEGAFGVIGRSGLASRWADSRFTDGPNGPEVFTVLLWEHPSVGG